MIHFLHPDMRKAPESRLTPRMLLQLVDGQWFEWSARLLVGVLTGAMLGLPLQAVQPAATGSGPAESVPPAAVSIDFLDDGRCHVSGEGQGFRSNATYTPQAAVQAEELRCAMPPVPKGGTVNLTVVLPKGAPHPASSEPGLEWRKSSEGRWSGSGSVTDWPEVVVIRAPRQTWTFWAPVAIAVILGVVGLRRRRARRARTA